MIDIQTQNIPLTANIESHIKEKLSPIIDHFGEYIAKISVHLSDENGPKGGDDQHCLVHIELLKLPTVVIEDTEPMLYAAIDNCCHRAERAVRKTLERKQTMARKQPG